MDRSIHEVAGLVGVTSRTLRHYDTIGLLKPSRIGHNGYRHYDHDALLRLQRILLLRDLGLGLTQIGEVLDQEVAESSALETHLQWLHQERERLSRQIASVESTVQAMKDGETLMAETMFDGFDHTQFREEVEERWGQNAYAHGDHWWRSMSDAQRAEWQRHANELAGDWAAAAENGVASASEQAQELAHRHVQWLRAIPGTPASDPEGDLKGYVLGLAEMYVSDPRFGAHYATAAGGRDGAEFVRDSLYIFAQAQL